MSSITPPPFGVRARKRRVRSSDGSSTNEGATEPAAGWSEDLAEAIERRPARRKSRAVRDRLLKLRREALPPVANTWLRADLLLPADAVVFVTAILWSDITPQIRDAWARLLAQTPGSALIVQRVGHDEPEADALRHHNTELDQVLAKHGVDDDRLVMMPGLLPAGADLPGVYGIGDVFLDLPCPHGDVAALAALSAGVPVVTFAANPERIRYVVSLLRSLELDELVADSPETCLSIAVRIARDPLLRARLAGRIRNVMSGAREFLQVLTAGIGFENGAARTEQVSIQAS